LPRASQAKGSRSTQSQNKKPRDYREAASPFNAFSIFFRLFPTFLTAFFTALADLLVFFDS
jgi:hypothetical protein